MNAGSAKKKKMNTRSPKYFCYFSKTTLKASTVVKFKLSPTFQFLKRSI